MSACADGPLLFDRWGNCLAEVGQGGVGRPWAACGDGCGAGHFDDDDDDDDADDDVHRVSAVGISTLSSCTSGYACE